MTEHPIEVVEVNEASSLAKTLSNKTAQKILSLIQSKENLTATEIAKELDFPLSTVQYNLKALTQAQIITDEDFHYSEKGKIVPHYNPSEKVIVIIPKKAKAKRQSLLTSLQTMIPGLLTASIAAIAVGIYATRSFFTQSTSDLATNARMAGGAAKMMADDVVLEAAIQEVPEAYAATNSNMLLGAQAPIEPSHAFFTPELAWGILIGMALVALATLVFVFFRQQKKRRITN